MMLDETTLHKGELGFPEKNEADSDHIWIFLALTSLCISWLELGSPQERLFLWYFWLGLDTPQIS